MTKLQLKVDEVRSDGRWERHCEHGIGHTVGHVDKAIWRSDKYVEVHGCDNCCAKWPRMERTSAK